jgi:hypothetical protein
MSLNYSYMVLLSEIDQLQAEIVAYKEAVRLLALEVRRMNGGDKPPLFGVVSSKGGKSIYPKEGQEPQENQVRPANGR